MIRLDGLCVSSIKTAIFGTYAGAAYSALPQKSGSSQNAGPGCLFPISMFCFIFCLHSRVLLCSSDCHLWWKLVKKIEEPTEAMKAPKGHFSFFVKSDCFFVFPKIEVCFSKLREFPKLLKLEFMEYTPTAIFTTLKKKYRITFPR